MHRCANKTCGIPRQCVPYMSASVMRLRHEEALRITDHLAPSYNHWHSALPSMTTTLPGSRPICNCKAYTADIEFAMNDDDDNIFEWFVLHWTCLVGTFGQPDLWDIYDSDTFQHPMAPYDVLVDPASLPSHPVIQERETIHDILYGEPEDESSTNDSDSSEKVCFAFSN